MGEKEQGMEVHICNPSSRELRTEFKAGLVYTGR